MKVNGKCRINNRSVRNIERNMSLGPSPATLGSDQNPPLAGQIVDNVSYVVSRIAYGESDTMSRLAATTVRVPPYLLSQQPHCP